MLDDHVCIGYLALVLVVDIKTLAQSEHYCKINQKEKNFEWVMVLI